MRMVWLFAALCALLAPSVRAQVDATAPGTLGGGSRAGAPTSPATDLKESGTPGRGSRSWEIVPTLSIEETYTDNLKLAPAGSERSDWVTQVRPGFSVRSNGARARFTASYAADLVYRMNEESRDIRHNFNFLGDAELIRQLLFIDARASVSQQNVSLLGPQTDSNVNVTGNRTTVGTLFVSPYLRRDFGQDSQGEVRLTYSAVNTGNSSAGASAASASDSDSNRLDMRLTSGPAFKLLTWNVAYSKEHIAYDSGQDIDIERISAGARRLITPTLGLKANVGYEDNNYITTGPALDGAFWSVGPEWTPTPRTRLSATAGRRFDKPNYALDFSHRTRLTTWSASYSDDVTTQRQQLLIPTSVDTAGILDTLFLARIPDPVTRQQAVQAFIAQTGLPPNLTVPVNFFTSTPFQQKRWQASFGIQGIRNTVMANVFKQTREATAAGGSGDFAASNDTTQTGASLIWTLRITGQTTSNVSVGYTRNEFSGLAREDDLTFIRLSLTRQFQPRVSGALNFRRLENNSNQSGAGYTENAVSAALSMRF